MGLLLLSTTICFSVSVPGCGAAWRLGLPVLVTSAPADAVDWSVVGSFSADSPPSDSGNAFSDSVVACSSSVGADSQSVVTFSCCVILGGFDGVSWSGSGDENADLIWFCLGGIGSSSSRS